MPQHFTALMCQAHISFWMLVHELLSPMAEFLPHIAPIPCGNVSLTTQRPFTDYCCTAGSGHTDWRKLHLPCMMKNCWWEKEGRKPLKLNNTPFLLSSHCCTQPIAFPWHPVRNRNAYAYQSLLYRKVECTKMVEDNAWSELDHSPQSPELHE